MRSENLPLLCPVARPKERIAVRGTVVHGNMASSTGHRTVPVPMETL